MTGLQFVNLGAEVIKVEPPDGAPSRHVGPFVDDQPDPDRSLAYWYYNGGKRSVVVDLESDDGRADARSPARRRRRVRRRRASPPAAPASDSTWPPSPPPTQR